MKTYTSKEIVETVIDAAEQNFCSYIVANKEAVEKRLNALFDFIRGIHIEKGRREEFCDDDVLGRARFVGEMIGSAYSYSTDLYSGRFMSTISGALVVHVFGYTIGRAICDYIQRDIFLIGMDFNEESLAESFAAALEENRRAEEEKEGK